MSEPRPASSPGPARSRPGQYGEWWNQNALGLDWYKEIFGVRTKVHDGFRAWFEAEHRRRPFRSIMEVGCGRAYPYADLFADFDYLGVDISAKEIAWCQEHYRRPNQRFWRGDILVESPGRRADLVFSHAVIDHVWDIDKFLTQLVAHTERALYVTAFRGWFPDLPAHRYEWLEAYTCYNNDVSVPQTRRLLAALGCNDFDVIPVQVDNVADRIERETVIIVRKS